MHYQHHGRPQGAPGHAYWPEWQGDRDGMLEHAWERMFGAILGAHGKIGAVSYHGPSQGPDKYGYVVAAAPGLPVVSGADFYPRKWHILATTNTSNTTSPSPSPSPRPSPSPSPSPSGNPLDSCTTDCTVSTSVSVVSVTDTFTGATVVFSSATISYTSSTVSFTSTTTAVVVSGAGGFLFTSSTTVSVSGAGISLTDTVQFVLEQSSTMAVTALFQVLATSQLQLLDTTVTTPSSVLYLGCTVGHTGLIISGTVSGSASLNVQTGAVQVTGGVVQVRVCLSDSCSTSYSFTNRRLAALPSTRSATTSATQYVCASVFGSTTIAVTSGAVLQLDTACTYGTIVDSTNTTVTVSSTTDTSTSTSTTVESGGTIQFVNVSSSSNIVNFNGPLVFASGSCLNISLADTSAITKDVARFVTSSCTLESATVSIENGGDVEYTVTAVAESSTACLIRVSNYSPDNDNGLYFLFLLFLIPVFLAPVVYYYAVGKKLNSTALATTEVLEYEEIDLTGAANFQPSSPYSDFDILAYEVPAYEVPAYEAYEEPYSDFDIPAYEVPAYEVPAYEVPAYEAYEEPYYN